MFILVSTNSMLLEFVSVELARGRPMVDVAVILISIVIVKVLLSELTSLR